MKGRRKGVDLENQLQGDQIEHKEELKEDLKQEPQTVFNSFCGIWYMNL